MGMLYFYPSECWLVVDRLRKSKTIQVRAVTIRTTGRGIAFLPFLPPTISRSKPTAVYEINTKLKYNKKCSYFEYLSKRYFLKDATNTRNLTSNHKQYAFFIGNDVPLIPEMLIKYRDSYFNPVRHWWGQWDEAEFDQRNLEELLIIKRRRKGDDDA